MAALRDLPAPDHAVAACFHLIPHARKVVGRGAGLTGGPASVVRTRFDVQRELRATAGLGHILRGQRQREAIRGGGV